MRTVRALIVDDEPLGRRAVRQLLAGHPDVVVTDECGDAEEAAGKVAGVDVVFLDVEMTGVSGMEFARALSGGAAPAVVFVTAHARYAVPAFDIPATDYLTKPVEPARLARALDRVRQRVATGATSLVARVGTRDVIVPASEVVAIEADGVYAAVHAGRRYLVRRSLNELEAALGEDFVRIHRSWMVRRSAITEVRRDATDGARTVVLANGLVVPVSRRRGPRLLQRVVGSE